MITKKTTFTSNEIDLLRTLHWTKEKHKEKEKEEKALFVSEVLFIIHWWYPKYLKIDKKKQNRRDKFVFII